MSKEETALVAIWVAAGIVVGFVAWTYVSPYIVNALPSTSGN